MRSFYRILIEYLRWDRSVIHEQSVKPFLPRYVLKEALHKINGSVSVGLACDRHERERVRDPAGHRKRFGDCLRQHSRDGRAVEASHRKYCQLGILDRFNGTDICDYIGLEIDMRNRRFVGRTMVKIRFAFMLRTVFEHGMDMSVLKAARMRSPPQAFKCAHEFTHRISTFVVGVGLKSEIHEVADRVF